ncbi:MAG: prenyltransferase [Thermoplasmata archaeon]
MSALKNKLLAFIKLSRLPFQEPILAPLISGILTAYFMGYRVENLFWIVFISIIVAYLIEQATLFSNEYFDYEGDLLNKNYTKFSGGSRSLSEGNLPRATGLIAMIVTTTILIIIGIIYMLTLYNLRPLFLIYGVIGIIFGIFYSTPPFKWAYRGVGELFIGIAFGVMGYTVGFYAIAGHITLLSVLFSIPSALSVFAIIVINEVPDYNSDISVRKKNLVVRFGTEKSIYYIYFPAIILTVLISILLGIMVFGVLGAIFSAILMIPLLTIITRWLYAIPKTKIKIESMQASTIFCNLIASFIPAILILLKVFIS